MTLWSDFEDEMERLPLDEDTADRLLAGAVPPADAPPGYARVAALIATAAEASSPEELAREAETVAILARAVRSSPVHPKKSARRSNVSPRRIAIALAVAALSGTTGLAFAGSLPGAAQDLASEMLVKVGVSVPGPDENAGTHPDTRGTAVDPAISPASAGKGAAIPELATSSDLAGQAKGAAVSTAASDGQSQAGEHGQASAPTVPTSVEAPVETPNEGGTPTADDASASASSEGTSAADTASDGASSAGSANAEAGLDRRP